MRKFYSFLSAVAFSMFALAACSSDDNTANPEPEIDHLIGKWNATSFHMRFEADGDVLTDNLDEEEGTTYGIIQQFEFKTDNTMEYYIYIPASEDEEEIERRGTTTYERNGNQLIMKNYYPYPFTILLVNDKKLNLYTIRESEDRKSTRLNSSHVRISYAVFCLKKKKKKKINK